MRETACINKGVIENFENSKLNNVLRFCTVCAPCVRVAVYPLPPHLQVVSFTVYRRVCPRLFPHIEKHIANTSSLDVSIKKLSIMRYRASIMRYRALHRLINTGSIPVLNDVFRRRVPSDLVPSSPRYTTPIP